MPFFSVNFDLKTKMPSTVINKKILKLIYLKKKKNPEGKGVARSPPGHLRGGGSHPYSLSFFFFFIKTRVFRSFLKLS
jgi:hypothetical protein